MRKEIVAMILAGGQGSRLGILTKKIAKPAVYFGGKYRIIDFSLSNCANSGIETVGVLTQYKPLILNKYIGVGEAWDLGQESVSILPPYMKEKGGEWYKGTANAIYQNIDYIDLFDPEYVLVLSGDHIYTMDYSLMLDYHKEKGADATIAVMEVPWEETNRFGIMNTRSDGRIHEFEEKPSKAKNNLASMGVYIFNWKLIKEHLVIDEQNPKSSNDFGKNVIPQLLQHHKKVYAYPFKGYWKDVGTIESLWEANMDLLKDKPELNLYDSNWKVCSVETSNGPQFIGEKAVVRNSMLHDGCTLFGEAHHSVIFRDVFIGNNTYIKDSIIMPNVKIEDNVMIHKAIIGENTVIKSGSIIGSRDKDSVQYNVEKNNKDIVVIGEGAIIDSGLKIGVNSIISAEDCEEIREISKEKEIAI